MKGLVNEGKQARSQLLRRKNKWADTEGSFSQNDRLERFIRMR